MSFPDMLYTLFISPLETLFELIYLLAYNIFSNPGFAIIGLSLAMNLLLLPLYRRTDAIQLEAIETEKRLKPYADHFKKTFQGDEQFMVLQTCYRQNHYKPTDAIKGIAPLLLEIPFFMAAYHYLSHLNMLRGASFGPIVNLGAPDGLLTLGAVTINVLPILMTLINLVSSFLYTKDAPVKTKIQLYGMAVIFLVLLYSSPSGLVFYWTLNNLFSLVKNALMKVKKPLRILGIGSSAVGLSVLIYAMINHNRVTVFQGAALTVIGLSLIVPLLLSFRRPRSGRHLKSAAVTGKDTAGFFTAGLLLTLLIGVVIPAAMIRTSPEEFLVKGMDLNPLTYVLHTGLVSAGLFLVWAGLFYALAKPAGKKAMGLVMWILCGMAVTDYMGFGRSYGLMSNQLIFDDPLKVTAGQILLNLAVLAAVIGIISLIYRKKPELLSGIGAAAAIAMVLMSGSDIVKSEQVIRPRLEQVQALPSDSPQISQIDNILQLSKQGKNVVVIMMDRAVNGLLPYMFYEKPELQQQYAGFTYYPNTLSYGAHTNFGLPALFGGYDYTPAQIQKRDQESLESKHNESLKVLPTLFSDSGFRTTVSDPSYAGYKWFPDLSVFHDRPDFHVQITNGHCSGDFPDLTGFSEVSMQRKFFCYSIFKVSPVLLHTTIYDNGSYQDFDHDGGQNGQLILNPLTSVGIKDTFMNAYDVLRSLPSKTKIVDSEENTFFMMCNDTAHEPMLLQLPDYTPAVKVDNTAFEGSAPQRSDGQGHTIALDSNLRASEYHINMAACMEVGRWLDYLRENNIYDNTRIIIVSDHGTALKVHDELILGQEYYDDIMCYNPILMVKDFGSTQFVTDESFMTNGDVPALALEGLIENPVNPFTGNPIDQSGKDTDVQYVCASHQWNVAKNNGNTFQDDPWYAVSGDMMNRDNWIPIAPDQVP